MWRIFVSLGWSLGRLAQDYAAIFGCIFFSKSASSQLPREKRREEGWRKVSWVVKWPLTANFGPIHGSSRSPHSSLRCIFLKLPSELRSSGRGAEGAVWNSDGSRLLEGSESECEKQELRLSETWSAENYRTTTWGRASRPSENGGFRESMDKRGQNKWATKDGCWECWTLCLNVNSTL